MKYWLRINGRDYGPLSEQEMVENREIPLTADALIAKVGDNEWQPLGTLLPGCSNPKSPRSMTRLFRVGMIVIFSLLCTVTISTNIYLLDRVPGISAAIGYPLVPALAALWWIVPFLMRPSLRDVGSFRFPMSWALLLIMPVVILNWCFSVYLLPIRMAWPVWIYLSHAMASGVFEELVFRGYAFRRVPSGHTRFVILTSAFCFSLAHSPYLFVRPVADVLHQLIFALVVGVALGIIRVISGSLAWCMLMHGAINAANPVNSAEKGKVPGLQYWTPYVIGLVAVALLIVLFVHSSFKNPSNPYDSPKGE